MPTRLHGALMLRALLRLLIAAFLGATAATRASHALTRPQAAARAARRQHTLSLRVGVRQVFREAGGRPSPHRGLRPGAQASPIAGPLALLCLLLALPAGAGASGRRARPEAESGEADKRLHKFIPDASRLAVEELRLEIERRLFRKHARTFVVAWGRVDAALHALLSRVPYPTDPKDVEVLEIALQLIREEDAELADYHERRWRAHTLQQIQGGAAPAG